MVATLKNSNTATLITYHLQSEDASGSFVKVFDIFSDTESDSPLFIYKLLNTDYLTELENFELSKPITVKVQFDDEVHYLAECVDIPVYAIGTTRNESIKNLKHEIEELYKELKDESNLSDEWLEYRTYLVDRIK